MRAASKRHVDGPVRGVAGKVERVDARAAINLVLRIQPDKDIIARAAKQDVPPRATLQRIVPCAAIDVIVPGTPVNDVIASIPQKRIVDLVSGDGVITIAADDILEIDKPCLLLRGTVAWPTHGNRRHTKGSTDPGTARPVRVLCDGKPGIACHRRAAADEIRLAAKARAHHMRVLAVFLFLCVSACATLQPQPARDPVVDHRQLPPPLSPPALPPAPACAAAGMWRRSGPG